MADGFLTYKYFLACKLHFTNEKYDLFEHNGRVKTNRESFERRNDKRLFEKLSRKFKKDKEIIQFIVANFAYNNTGFVWDDNSVSEDNYIRWMKTKESIHHTFKKDLSTLKFIQEQNKFPFDRLIKMLDKDSPYPVLLTAYLGKQVTIETLVILEDVYKYLDKWEENILLSEDHFLKIRRLKPFVKYNQEKVQQLINEFEAE
jgi:hypothetical protein